MYFLGLVDIPLSWIILVIIAILLYFYGKAPFHFWENHGVKGPSPYPFVGNLVEYYLCGGSREPLGRWQKEFGRVYGIYNFREPLLVVSDLDIVQEVLVQQFDKFPGRYFTTGELFLNDQVQRGLSFSGKNDWLKARSILSPIFHNDKINPFTMRINKCAKSLRTKVFEFALREELFDAKKMFDEFMMDAMASTTLGLEFGSDDASDNLFRAHSQGLFNFPKHFTAFFLALEIFPRVFGPLFKLLDLKLFKKHDLQYFHDLVEKLLSAKEKRRGDGISLVELLTQAETQGFQQGRDTKVNALTREELVSHVLSFLITAFASTSSTLSFVVYELSRNHHVQQKLLWEIDENFGEIEPTSERLQMLTYMDAVVKETLRMHPPFTHISRVARETTKLKETPVPAGTGILIPASSIGRDPEYFDEPDKFRPERFLAHDAPNPVSFLSFGLGQRQCLAKNLAMLKLKMALVHLLKSVTFDHPEPHSLVTSDVSAVLKPTEALMVLALRRPDACSDYGVL